MTLRVTGAPFGLATSAGRRRGHNEDAALAGPDWYVVADGMGGHAAGEIASRLVVETFASIQPDNAAIVGSIRAACERANTAVRHRAAHDGTHGMGSTIVGLVPGPHRDPYPDPAEPSRPTGPTLFHVGDSRCYRLVDGELRLYTRDHSHVQELIEAGRLTTAQARRHPLRNVVTRAIGLDRDVIPEIVRLDPRPSRYLLCTDGLVAEIGPRVIGRVLAGTDSPDAAARRLVELAREGEASDDMTALVVDLVEAGNNGPGRHDTEPRLGIGRSST